MIDGVPLQNTVGQTGSLHTESYIENAIAKPLNKAMIEWFVGHLVHGDADKKDPRLDLVHADLGKGGSTHRRRPAQLGAG